MLRNKPFNTENIMHAEFVETIARQHIAQLHAAADHQRLASRGEPVHQPSLRTRLGWLLVRWGQRLAPTPRVTAHPPRPATMGP
jgi:hypothetical protein